MFGKWAMNFLTDPLKGIGKITEKNPTKYIWLLSSILGSIFLISIFQEFALGQHLLLWQILGLIIVLSPIVGYLLVTIASWVIAGTGLWIGTRGKFKNIRCALTYSLLPLLGVLFCKVLLFFIFGENFFLNFPKELSLFEAFFYYTLMIFEVFFLIWSLFLLVVSLAAVKHTSLGKAIVNLILAFVVYIVIIFLITLPFRVRCSNFFDFPELTHSSSYEGWEDSLF